MSDDVRVVLFTLGTAAAATAWIFVPAVAVAWVLSRGRGPLRAVLEAVVSLPLVLPPTAVGLGLLLLLGGSGPLAFIDAAFTWRAVVVACGVMAFPLLARSVRAGLEEVDPRLVGVARTLGRGPFGAFLSVHLPLAWRSVLSGTVLAFARALGEFGATILVAGNIPGRTQTLALRIFQDVQTGRDAHALRLAAIAALLALGALFAADHLTRRRERALEA